MLIVYFQVRSIRNSMIFQISRTSMEDLLKEGKTSLEGTW